MVLGLKPSLRASTYREEDGLCDSLLAVILHPLHDLPAVPMGNGGKDSHIKRLDAIRGVGWKVVRLDVIVKT
jgi:hypothetical protein